jgi:hypothetical protein
MSQSDFLIRPGLYNSGTEYTGSAVLNNTLSNPLTSSDNCRVLNEDNNNGSWRTGLFFVSSSVSGGMFINIPETKSVSLRIWGRINDGAGSSNHAISLLAKHNGYNVSVPSGDSNGSIPRSGYEFGLDGGFSGRFFYRFGNYKTSTDGNYQQIYTEDIRNKWVGLRMDIVPVRVNKIVNGTPVSGTLKDIITLYTASVAAPDTWTQIGSTYELLIEGNQFVPWGSYTATSPIAGTVATSSYGFYTSMYTDNGAPRMYYDDFKIFVEDAF